MGGRILAFIVVGLFISATLADDARQLSTTSKDDVVGLMPLEHYRSLINRDVQEAEIGRLKAAGKLAEACALGNKMLSIDREVLRNEPQRLCRSLELVAQLHAEQREFRQAVALHDERHRLYSVLPDVPSEDVLMNKRLVEVLRQMAGWSESQRQVFAEAIKASEAAVELGIGGDWPEANKTFDEVMQQMGTLLEPNHIVLGCLNYMWAETLAVGNEVPLSVGRYQKAEQILLASIDQDSPPVREVRDKYAAVLRQAVELHLDNNADKTSFEDNRREDG